ncbi:MAG: Protein of unknown function (DUF1553)/Protein of unknown function (DUF1549)/Planctomycete [Planctomycetaceae bacterium]|nr:Protein of unknown function (DUF1553)/Protein of unknown function (DUF1549)/Planctomycete [Planctomycetaceae bacterium]
MAGLFAITSMLGATCIQDSPPFAQAANTLLEEKSDDTEFDAADLKFFRDEIEPVLKESCHRCHGEKKQESNLRLDSREALLKGGKNGPTIVPGKPDESLLLKVLEYTGDIQMPPDEKLDDETRDAMKKWIEKKAPWPKVKAKQ